MTKNEASDKYFVEFCEWCAKVPEGSNIDRIFWLDHRFPTEDNFWEWFVRYKAGRDD